MRRYTANGIEFVALDQGEPVPGHRIVVRYHDIDSLLGYEYRQKSLVVREQFWREIPQIAARVKGLSARLADAGIPLAAQMAPRESGGGAKLPSLHSLTFKFLQAVEAPPPSIGEKLIVRAVREHVIGPEQPIYDAHAAMIDAIKDLATSYRVNMHRVSAIVGEILLESRVMGSRQTGATWAEQHLKALRGSGLLDWFMLDVKPATGTLNDRIIKGNKGPSEFYYRITPNIVFRLEIVVPDPEKLRGTRFAKVFKPAVVLAPALFRVIRVLREASSAHVPVILDGDRRTQDATLEAVHDAALAEPLGREILEHEQSSLVASRQQYAHGRLSAMELAFLPMYKHEALDESESGSSRRYSEEIAPSRWGSALRAQKQEMPTEEDNWKRFEHMMGSGAHHAPAAEHLYPTSVGGESLKYMANVDVVRRMVYGISRAGGHKRETLSAPEVELCLSVAGHVQGELYKLSGLYASSQMPGRIIMRQNYSFLADYAIQNVSEIIQFLAEQRRLFGRS